MSEKEMSTEDLIGRLSDSDDLKRSLAVEELRGRGSPEALVPLTVLIEKEGRDTFFTICCANALKRIDFPNITDHDLVEAAVKLRALLKDIFPAGEMTEKLSAALEGLMETWEMRRGDLIGLAGDSTNVERMVEAIELLGRMGEVDAIDVLAGQIISFPPDIARGTPGNIAHPDPKVRVASINALANVLSGLNPKDERRSSLYFEHVLEACEEGGRELRHPEKEVRLAAVNACGLMGDPSAFPYLVEMLRPVERRTNIFSRNEEREVILAAANALGNMNYENEGSPELGSYAGVIRNLLGYYKNDSEVIGLLLDAQSRIFATLSDKYAGLARDTKGMARALAPPEGTRAVPAAQMRT